MYMFEKNYCPVKGNDHFYIGLFSELRAPWQFLNSVLMQILLIWGRVVVVNFRLCSCCFYSDDWRGINFDKLVKLLLC